MIFDMLEQWFEQYGYLVLLIGLPLDFIALPIPPGNSTLTYTGYLAHKDVLEPFPALASAMTGALSGITITYCIGYKLGMPLIERYGRYLFLNPTMLEKTKRYYEKYGDKLLLIIFFIPGIRQFIGYFVGIIRVPFRIIMIYAYLGAMLWVLFFFGIGYLFGEQWQLVFKLVQQYILYVVLGIGCILVLVLILKQLKRSK